MDIAAAYDGVSIAIFMFADSCAYVQQAVSTRVNNKWVDPMAIMLQIGPECRAILGAADTPNRVSVINDVIDF